MKKFLLLSGVVLWAYLFISTGLFASEKKQAPVDVKAGDGEAARLSDGPQVTLKFPLSSSAFSALPVAIVNDEQITLKDLNDALASSHEGMAADKKQAARIDYSEILRRLINVKLLVQEARNIGIDELPEIKNMVDVFSKATLRELLQKQRVKNVKADEKEVKRLYQEMVREWKVKSLLFEKETDAQEFEKKIKAGGNFDDMVGEALAAGTAKGGEEGVYLKNKDVLPQIAAALSGMKAGSVSPAIKVVSGYAIFRLDDVRFPDDPETKEKIRQKVLNAKQIEVLTNYNKALSKKYIKKLNKDIVNALDFESEKLDIDKLLKDKRVIAEIKGEKSITAGELTEALISKLYHGAESTKKSGKGKKLNQKKLEVLEELLGKKVLRLEALKKGINKTEEYKSMIKEYESSLIFGLFIQKVIIPDIKVSEEEMKTYYSDHLSEFTYPEMISISGLVFGKVDDAGAALDKLRKGADFNWVKANADGQVDRSTKGLLSFEGNTITTNELPPEVQKTVSGVKGGDFRLHAGTDGYFYVLYVQNVVPSKEQPFEEVNGVISKKIFSEKVSKSVEEWASKLEESGAVKIYLAGSEK